LIADIELHLTRRVFGSRWRSQDKPVAYVARTAGRNGKEVVTPEIDFPD
jgi:hypothetical protein